APQPEHLPAERGHRCRMLRALADRQSLTQPTLALVEAAVADGTAGAVPAHEPLLDRLAELRREMAEDVELAIRRGHRAERAPRPPRRQTCRARRRARRHAYAPRRARAAARSGAPRRAA